MSFKLSVFAIIIFSYSVTVQANEPIQVFLLAGQSNMQGQGVVSMNHEKYYNGGKGNLEWSMQNSKSKEMMKHLKTEDGEWTVRDDVEIAYKTKLQSFLGFAFFRARTSAWERIGFPIFGPGLKARSIPSP